MFRILLSADLPGITNTSLGDKERPKLNTLKPKDFQLNLKGRTSAPNTPPRNSRKRPACALEESNGNSTSNRQSPPSLQQKLKFDFERLKNVTKVITKNLNKIIDINYYPVPQAERSNLRHRPIGIGVQV